MLRMVEPQQGRSLGHWHQGVLYQPRTDNLYNFVIENVNIFWATLYLLCLSMPLSPVLFGWNDGHPVNETWLHDHHPKPSLRLRNCTSPHSSLHPPNCMHHNLLRRCRNENSFPFWLIFAYWTAWFRGHCRGWYVNFVTETIRVLLLSLVSTEC